MSVTLEDSANSKSRYIGQRDLTEDDIRYNAELDREDRTIRSRKRRRYKSRLKKRDWKQEEV